MSVVSLALLAGCGMVPPLAQPAKVPRIGALTLDAPPASELVEPLRHGLQELGYVEGQTISLELRFADGNEERLAELAAELVALPVDVIVAAGSQASRAAKKATSTVPIVFAVSGDPVGAGLVESLAHPGGNVTGPTSFSTQLSGKKLELLSEVVPGLSRVAVLFNPDNPGDAREWAESQAAAGTLRVELLALEVRQREEFAGAFEAATRGRAEALTVSGNPLTNSHRPLIAEFAAKNRLASISSPRGFVAAGGLMAYGPDYFHLTARAATYVDKILKGAKPADLPVEQPTKFELIVNLKTAQALGLTIPESVLLQAAELIQ